MDTSKLSEEENQKYKVGERKQGHTNEIAGVGKWVVYVYGQCDLCQWGMVFST